MNLLSLVGPRLDNICQIRQKWYYLLGSLFLQSERGPSTFICCRTSIQSWCIFDAVYLLDSVMEREFAFRDAKVHCDLTSWEECENVLYQILQPSAASYSTKQTKCIHVCSLLKRWKADNEDLKVFFFSLVSKFRSQVQSRRPSELPFEKT